MRPVGLIGGQRMVGSTRMIPIASATGHNIFFGAPVKIVAAGVVEKDVPDAAMTPCGIFMGCSYTDPNTNQKTFKQYWPSGTVATDAIAYVFDDPDAVFKVQADEAVAQTALGANAAMASDAGSTATGNSTCVLDGSSVNTTNTLPLRIVGFVDATDSAVGDAFTDVLVKWNFGMHAYENATGI